VTTVQIIANPVVTIGRAFTDTFAGIAPVDVLGFVLAQGVGLLVGVAAISAWYPRGTDTPAGAASSRTASPLAQEEVSI
jgi:arsenate reductase (thioredoxin)